MNGAKAYKTKYIGVRKRCRKYLAFFDSQIIGSFDCAVQAARARDAYASENTKRPYRLKLNFEVAK